MATFAALLASFRAGSPAALARAISIVEDQRDGFEELLHEVLVRSAIARRVGLTGPPGAGKSTLVAKLAAAYRSEGDRVGVVAVDPSSPYSGGALLGDRIRMGDLAGDSGIFVRSMASRGSLGGLASTTREVVDLMEGFGFERVLVESVGVGQTELEIAAAADTVVVVLVPEFGDAVQAMKAGLMEIADVFVVNKADRPGADRLVTEIREAIQLRATSGLRGPGAAGGGGSGVEPRWEIPVLATDALSGEGVQDLLDAIEAHRRWLEESGELAFRRRLRAGRRVRDIVARELERVAWSSEEAVARLDAGIDRIEGGEATPYSVAREVLDTLLR